MALTAEQREARRAGIGGSDAPVILGLSPHRTPVELWAEKVGLADPVNLDDSEPVRFGHLLEDVVAREWARRAGVKVARVLKTQRHPEHAFMLAHPDRRVVGRPELLEVKTVRGLGDEPREDHVAQVLHYCAVLGYERGHLAYLIGGQRLVSFTIERDDDAIAHLVEAEREFWFRVKDRQPPPVRSLADLRLLYPVSAARSVTASDEAVRALDELHRVKAQIAALEEREQALQATVCTELADAEVLLDRRGRTLATWKSSKPSRVIDTKRLQAEHPELAYVYTTDRPGSRRFLLKDAPSTPEIGAVSGAGAALAPLVVPAPIPDACARSEAVFCATERGAA